MQDPRYVPPQGSPTMQRRPVLASTGTRLPRTAAAVGRARRYVVTALTELHVPAPVVDSAALVASELVTNAYRHGRRGAVRLLLDLWPDGALTITVADQTPYVPLPAAVPVDEDSECGRGLLLVESLSQEWGHRPVGGSPERGTAVWATLTGATP